MHDRLVIHFEEPALNHLMRVHSSIHPFVSIRRVCRRNVRYDAQDPINDVDPVTIGVLLKDTVILHLVS